MKCDEPKVYKVYTTRNAGAFGFCEGTDPTDIELEHESVCLKSDVDEFIAELKEKLHDVDNQWNEQCKEIAELKAKLESVQATAYADSVDAGMRERRLRRALWLARAERAIAEAEYWYGHISGMYYIDAMEVPDEEDNYYKRVKDTSIGWYKTWMEVERKCRAKAEEYR